MTQTYTAAQDVRLRPLSTGEIFDRAITLFVRNLPPFLIVSAFVAVPFAVGQYFLTAGGGGWVQVVEQTQHPKIVPVVPMSPLVSIMLLGVLMQPFCYVAIAALVGRLYRGEPLDWRAGYAVAFRRTGGIVLTIFVGIAVYMSFLIVFMIVSVAGVGVTAALLRALWPLGVISGAITAALAIAAILWLFLMFLALGLAFNAIGIEQTPAGTAISEGFARVFGSWKKALVIVLALGAVQIGAMFLAMALQGLSEAVFHSALLDGALSGTLTLFSGAFFGVLLGVYYFDVRVRREGLDVEDALDRLTAQPQA